MNKYKTSESYEATKKIFEILESKKLSWWIRFLLFFKKPYCGVDYGIVHGQPVIVCVKKLWGICYITHYIDTEKLNLNGGLNVKI